MGLGELIAMGSLLLIVAGWIYAILAITSTTITSLVKWFSISFKKVGIKETCFIAQKNTSFFCVALTGYLFLILLESLLLVAPFFFLWCMFFSATVK